MPEEEIGHPLPPSWVNLPTEVLIHIFGYVLGTTDEKAQWPTKVNEVGALSQTCRTFFHILEPQLKKQAKQLLMDVLQGNAENAEKSFSKNPELLFMKTIGREHAAGIDEAGNAVHRIVKASPYRAALGAGDIDLLHKMMVHFEKVGNSGRTFHNPERKTGWEIARAQFAEQFPGGVVAYPKSTYRPNFKALAKAISNDPVLAQNFSANPELVKNLSAFVQFRNDFLPTEVVTSGHYFNLNHLLKAIEVYNLYWDQLNWSQCSLYWCQVIGYLERLVPAVDAQAFCQGLYKLLKEKQPRSRDLNMPNSDTGTTTAYFPLPPGAAAGLGVDSGAYIGYRAPELAICAGWEPLELLEKLVRKKISGLEDFKKILEQQVYATEQRSSSCCFMFRR